MRESTSAPTPRPRQSSRVRDVKMEYDNMPRTPAPFSRGVTPSGRIIGRGNNRFGNKGTKKCVRCRQLKRACKFNDPKDICELCASRGEGCSDKIMSVDQAKIKEEAEGDVKRLAAQGHLQWNEEDNFLQNVLYLTRNHMDPRTVVLKLHAEIVFYRQAQDQALPAPQVVPQDPNGFLPFGSVQMQQPQEMDPYANLFAPAPPNYATQLQPVPEIFVTQFQNHSPIGTPQLYNEGHQAIPKLPTPQPQSLEPSNPPDYGDQTSVYDWNIFSSQDYQMDWENNLNDF